MRTSTGRDVIPAVPATSRPGTDHRWHGSAMVGSLVLGAVIFTIAVVTGAWLSGAAAVDPLDRRYAYSLIITGVGGLAVSVTGIVLVARRRRHW
jgi:hypothetical protein